MTESQPSQVRRLSLERTPEKNDIWAAAEAHAEEMDVENVKRAHPDGDSSIWYCPTVTIGSAYRAERLFDQYSIETVYDLGAGDCRFSLWLDRRGYDVVAYEINEELVNGVAKRFCLGDIDLRNEDYYEDFDSLTGSKVAVVCFGGTNELPSVPDHGLAIEGYSEIGITAWYDGQEVAKW